MYVDISISMSTVLIDFNVDTESTRLSLSIVSNNISNAINHE